MAETAPRPLSAKQQQFVAAYLGRARGNATEAARIAGYKQANASGTENLANPSIRARIDAELEARTMTDREVLAELTAVASVEWHVLARARELGSKVKALELLGKYHKLFAERVELSGKDGAPLTFTIQIDRGDAGDAGN